MTDRMLCILIGYGFGCFLTAAAVERLCGKGRGGFTGNPGAAAVGAHFGPKAGAAVLLGDLLKTASAILLCRYLLFAQMGSAAALYAGTGCVLGHDFPFWRRFHGGKGVTATCLTAVLFHPPVGLLCCLAGLLTVLASRYLALGAVAVAALFPLLAGAMGLEADLVWPAAGLGLVMLLKFIPSLRRMAKGEEKRTDLLRLLDRKSGG